MDLLNRSLCRRLLPNVTDGILECRHSSIILSCHTLNFNSSINLEINVTGCFHGFPVVLVTIVGHSSPSRYRIWAQHDSSWTIWIGANSWRHRSHIKAFYKDSRWGFGRSDSAPKLTPQVFRLNSRKVIVGVAVDILWSTLHLWNSCIFSEQYIQSVVLHFDILIFSKSALNGLTNWI